MSNIAKSIKHGLDPVAFAIEELDFVPDEWQENVLRYNGDRLIMLCSRQTGKSTVASIMALHKALFNPGSLTLVVSPSQRQSGELFRKIVGEMNKLVYKPQKIEDNRLSMTLQSGSRIVSLPSQESTVRGFSSPDLVIIDEASRVTDSLYFALRPMLAVSGGQLILLSTPAGRQGFFFEAWESESGWEKVKILAKDCPRITPEFLREELATLGKWFYSQKYECEFVEGEQSMFRYDDVMAAFNPEVKALKLWERDDQNGH